jgi:hypothetical protein
MTNQVRTRLMPLMILALLAVPVQVRAQEPAANHTIGVNAGIVDLDLAATGVYVGAAVRATRALTGHLGLEAGALLTRYDSAPDATTLLVPDVQLQYHWRMGPARGYAGAGPGLAWSRHHGQSGISISFSTAGGVRAPLTERLALVVELRVRSLRRHLSGSTAEMMGGLSWRLGSAPSARPVTN